MTKDEALKLALDALENGDVPTPENVGKNLDAITAIKEALAQPEEEPVATLFGSLPVYDTTPPQRTEQEPVAWREFIEQVAKQKPEKPDYWSSCSQCERNINDAEDLLEAPPPQEQQSCDKRTWVGLEGEEIRNLWEEATKPDRSTMTMVTSFAKSIEAKLKDKNGYAEENT